MHWFNPRLYYCTMIGSVVLLTLLPGFILCAGEGNVRLLENEITSALKICTNVDTSSSKENTSNEHQRRRRSENSHGGSQKVEDNKQGNQYGHERRNSSDGRDEVQVMNTTDYNHNENNSGNATEKNSTDNTGNSNAGTGHTNTVNAVRTKRSEDLFSKPDDQCLSQCVFANLQVVDARGIPRETELWNKIQSSVTSQQSRTALRDQIRACFQELQSEAEDNGCSYSNKLERCLMLRFSDRKTDSQEVAENLE